MKTKVFLAVALLAGFAASAHAASIVGTKHDLSSAMTTGSSIHSTDQNQTCVFCHAPHNAITNKLLWNRNYLAGSGMKIYTSYNTAAMRTAMDTTTNKALGDDSSSLLCLSCHSLTTASDIITNTANSKGGTTNADVGQWATAGSMNNLTNDHPVGINYATALAVPNSALNTIVSITGAMAPTTGGLRLFKSAAGGADSMECASCHSVHDNTSGKFLAKSNTGSNLCVTCHIK